MFATGIRTPVGITIFGPDLAELERLGKDVERAVQMVPGTRRAFAKRAVSGYYLDILPPPGPRAPPAPATSPNATTSTDGVGRPTSSPS